MKTISRALLILWLAVDLRADETPATGFYDFSDVQHPVAMSQDQFTRFDVEYINNDNSRYQLVVYTKHELIPHRFGMIADGKTFPFSGHGHNLLTGLRSYAFTGNDPETAKEFVRTFHPKIRERHHPGHRMQVAFVPAKKEFTEGEPVDVKLRITNVGDSSFAFQQGGKQRGARDNQFAFSARGLDGKAVPDVGNPQHMGGLNGIVTIKPGESHEIPVDLAKWFSFQKGGHYRILGSYEMDFFDPADNDLFGFCLWHDYATAEFGIKMQK